MRVIRATIILMMLACTAAFADTVTILNGSFENPSVGMNNWSTSVPGWVVNGSAGVYQPPAGVLTATDGTQVAWINSGSVSQTLSETVQANYDYTLSVDVGQRADGGLTNYYVDLFAGNTLVASDSGSLHPAAGGWLTSTLNFSTGTNPGELGQAFTIVLGIPNAEGWAGFQADFDNVRMTAVDPPPGTDVAAVVPEPSSLFLLGTAAVGLLDRRRRK